MTRETMIATDLFARTVVELMQTGCRSAQRRRFGLEESRPEHACILVMGNAPSLRLGEALGIVVVEFVQFSRPRISSRMALLYSARACMGWSALRLAPTWARGIWHGRHEWHIGVEDWGDADVRLYLPLSTKVGAKKSP